jgi:arsenate reductase (glutaredoxin)
MFAGHPTEITDYAALALMEVQVFGIKKSADTRKALRFFSERRIRAHFVDLDERPAAAGELKRFVQKFGIEAVLDRESKAYVELGLRHAKLSEERWLQKLMDEPRLLRMPLVRQLGQQGSGKLTIGLAEKDWKEWVEQTKAS